jgi:hypothetical protein
MLPGGRQIHQLVGDHFFNLAAHHRAAMCGSVVPGRRGRRPRLDDGSCLPDGLAATVITPVCDATLPNAITRQLVGVIDVPDL